MIGFVAEESSGCFGRHIVLAEVNTVSADSQRHIHSIVDDQLRLRSFAAATAAARLVRKTAKPAVAFREAE